MLVWYLHSVVNDRFDENPKRWKMLSVVMLELSCFLELMAPLAPKFFLVIASLANIGKPWQPHNLPQIVAELSLCGVNG